MKNQLRGFVGHIAGKPERNVFGLEVTDYNQSVALPPALVAINVGVFMELLFICSKLHDIVAFTVSDQFLIIMEYRVGIVISFLNVDFVEIGIYLDPGFVRS